LLLLVCRVLREVRPLSLFGNWVMLPSAYVLSNENGINIEGALKEGART